MPRRVDALDGRGVQGNEPRTASRSLSFALVALLRALLRAPPPVPTDDGRVQGHARLPRAAAHPLPRQAPRRALGAAAAPASHQLGRRAARRRDAGIIRRRRLSRAARRRRRRRRRSVGVTIGKEGYDAASRPRDPRRRENSPATMSPRARARTGHGMAIDRSNPPARRWTSRRRSAAPSGRATA